MPQVRRGEPGEPVILSNGLPKLRPGELEKLGFAVERHVVPADVVRSVGMLPVGLTSVDNMLEELCTTAVNRLLDVRDGKEPSRMTILSGRLVRRDTF